MINIDVINECAKKQLSFPESIKRLKEIGIERYYTDLVRMEKIYYSHNGESHVERMPIDNMPELAETFNEAKVIEALRSIQNGETDYHVFIRSIVAAGIANYIVYIDGRHVNYIGRKGELYTEKFPF
jgi:uncharacterized protein YbcV (DUF1398 family)